MDVDPGLALPHLWQAATASVPVVVVGGGRWGKVWASVISSAQGGAHNLLMAARTDPKTARAWASSDPGFTDLVVCESIAEAVERRADLKAAIVCSRPQDHLADVLEALRCGLHVLVEKPISTNADNAMRMWSAAQHVQRRLAVGTEFAFVPAVHQCAHAWDLGTRDALQIHMTWEDPVLEARYGFTKARHPEVSALGDLLPHAFSIFWTLAPERVLHIDGAGQEDDGSAGWIRLRDSRSGVFTLAFDLASKQRQRRVEVSAGPDTWEIDFSDKLSSMKVNQQPHPLDPRLVPLTSTLRLQWGAFLASLPGGEPHADMDFSVSALIRLQKELESFTR